MLSSVAGLLGNPSQANYAAGNTFQDTFASYRQAQGLPALSIDVGFVTDVGWTASHRDLVHNAKEHMQIEITSKDIAALIEHHVIRWIESLDKNGAPPAAQVALGLGGLLPEDPRFSQVEASRAQASTVDNNTSISAVQESVKSKLAAAGDDKAKLLEIMSTAMGDKLAQLLSLQRENVQLDDTFASHGVDSLVAVEIRSWVGKELGAKLVVSEILNASTTIRDVLKGFVESEQLM